MAIRTCRECGQTGNTKARTCPHCGSTNTGTRGLSDLHKCILRLAWQNRVKQRSHETGEADVFRPEVLHEHYGFPYRKNWLSFAAIRRFFGFCFRVEGRKNLYDHQAFSIREIGSERFKAAQASVTQAFVELEKWGLIQARLETRGTIARWWHGEPLFWTGADLTDEGIELRDSLSDDSGKERPRPNAHQFISGALHRWPSTVEMQDLWHTLCDGEMESDMRRLVAIPTVGMRENDELNDTILRFTDKTAFAARYMVLLRKYSKAHQKIQDKRRTAKPSGKAAEILAYREIYLRLAQRKLEELERWFFVCFAAPEDGCPEDQEGRRRVIERYASKGVGCAGVFLLLFAVLASGISFILF